MYFVILAGGERHSAWATRREAVEQIRVLKDYGYRGVSYEYLAGVDCENGQYFV